MVVLAASLLSFVLVLFVVESVDAFTSCCMLHRSLGVQHELVSWPVDCFQLCCDTQCTAKLHATPQETSPSSFRSHGEQEIQILSLDLISATKRQPNADQTSAKRQRTPNEYDMLCLGLCERLYSVRTGKSNIDHCFFDKHLRFAGCKWPDSQIDTRLKRVCRL